MPDRFPPFRLQRSSRVYSILRDIETPAPEAYVSFLSSTTAVGFALLGLACTNPADPATIDPTAAVLSVTPANAATNVNRDAPVTVTFNRRMMSGMELRVVLHEGSVTGAPVGGTYAWSADRSTLTFVPSVALRSNASYVLHLAADLRTDAGMQLNHANCGSVGGRNVTAEMMGGGMMRNGAMGGGMMSEGWQPVRGSHGMIFTFTTT